MTNKLALKAAVELKGRYKMRVHDGRGNNRIETGWFDNLITDNGLDLIGETGGFLAHFSVGSGSTAPANSDTSLVSEVATTGTTPGGLGVFAGTVNATIDAGLRECSILREYEFGEGVAAGNLSEIGIGWYNTNLFSRALILDGVLSPTTITVLSNEFLTVTYELVINQPMTDFSALVSADATGTATAAHTGTQLTDSAAAFLTTATVGGTIHNLADGSSAVITSVDSDSQITHGALSGGTEDDWDVSDSYRINGWQVTGRMMRANNSSYWGLYPQIWIPQDINSPVNTRIYDGVIGATVDDAPSGTFSNVTSVTNDVYISSSYARSADLYWNISANHEAESMAVFMGIGYFQFGFSPPIPKDNTKTLTVNLQIAWAREGEL